jgi:hypothetical protein
MVGPAWAMAKLVVSRRAATARMRVQGLGMVGSLWLKSGGTGAHGEVVHLPVGLDAVMADEGGELGVVTDGVHEGVDEDGTAGGGEGAETAGLEGDGLFPVVARLGDDGLEEGDGLAVDGEDGFSGVYGNLFVGGLGDGVEALGVAQLGGDDVLEETGDAGGLADVAGDGEDLGVCGDELLPVPGGGVDPGDELFGGECGGWVWHVGYLI